MDNFFKNIARLTDPAARDIINPDGVHMTKFKVAAGSGAAKNHRGVPCGAAGAGHLAELTKIFAELQNLFS